MSTIPETMAAHSLGLEVFALSLITNLAAGLSDEILTHGAVSFLYSCTPDLPLTKGYRSCRKYCSKFRQFYEEISYQSERSTKFH